MTKLLRTSLLMLFYLLVVPLSFAWEVVVDVRLGTTSTSHSLVAEVSNPEQGKVYGQFGKSSFKQSQTVTNTGDDAYKAYFEHSAPKETPTLDDYNSKVEAEMTGYNTPPKHCEVSIYLYAEPNPGYVFDFWEIKSDANTQTIDPETDEVIDPLNITSKEKNYNFLWVHKARDNYKQFSEIYAIAHFKEAVTEPTEPQLPENSKIQGYFRIQNVGNEKFVEVTGPFSAAPTMSHEDAQSSAGTVMYVEAVADGPSYRVTHLRSQGIDVVGIEDFTSADYENVLHGIELNADNLFNDLAYSLVRKGFTYGYTNVGRATVGSVFLMVAAALDKKKKGEVPGYEYTQDDYFEVAKDFNSHVTDNLDLGIRLYPVDNDNQTVQVYFDVPSLSAVCDWYNEEGATLDNGKSRHDVFASAMLAMSDYMKAYTLETFYPSDITLFDSWGYTDFKNKYAEYKNDEGAIELTFDRIFSDEVLLFNWIKMVGYYILNPKEDTIHGIGGFFGDANLGEAAKEHYLTSLFVDYLPRIHHNSRAYLVTDETNKLNFASRSELETAGDNAAWKLCAIDNVNQKFVVNHKHQEAKKNNGTSIETFGGSALYYDFPVSVPAENASALFSLGNGLYKTTIGNYSYVFNMVESLPGTVPAQTPFLMKTPEGASAQLIIPNDNCVFAEVIEGVEENTPAATADDEAEAVAPNSMAGVLLRTSLTNDDYKNLWDGDKEDIYTLNQYDNGEYPNLIFNDPAANYLNANEAVYIISSQTEPYEVSTEEALASLGLNFVLIGEPEWVEVENPEVPAVTKIKGYFRIQNVGNNEYVEVTGPFTARPDQDYAAAEKSAGTVMYVEAVQDGDADSYRITHLRSQGIDVVGVEDFSADEYTEVLGELADKILDSGEDLFNSIAYGLVRKGFTYGYTNIARATVGSVFWIVAAALERHATGSLEGYEFEKNDYIQVAEDFNREVTAKLDLGIRMKPLNYDEKTVQVYFDVPSLKAVCDWYNDTDAKLESGKSRHDVFASAMLSMGDFMSDFNLETFTASDIALFNSWGYDITKSYTPNNGEIALKFHDIFTDEVLLFNWIKMVGYYILNPEEDQDRKIGNFFGGVDLAGAANQHYLTGMLVSYLPRIHHNSRAYLINGRVGADGVSGGVFDQSKVGTLGFASGAELNQAGDYAAWKLCPIDNVNQKFVVEHKHQSIVKSEDETFDASALYFDFPISAADTEATSFYTLTDELYYTEIDKMRYTYNKVLPLSGEIDRLTPFVMKTTNGESSQLMVADGQCYFLPLSADGAGEAVPSAVSDVETLKMTSLVSPLYLSDETNEYNALKGVLLATSLNNDDLANLWDGTTDIYPFNEIEGHVGFSAPQTTSLKANESVYIPQTSPEPIYEEPEKAKESLEESFVYIGEPEEIIPTGVDAVAVDSANDNGIIYDLRGIRVTKPVPGNIYILNGQKVVFK